MNKGVIQKFAIWARNELIAQVSQRAYQYGIDESGFGDASADTLNGRLLTTEEKSQRQELIKQIKEKGYKQVMEEVAYTWFNRFIALRFMEVNNYLPSHIRVFSDASGAFKPEILNDVLHLDLPGLDSGKVAEYIESNDTEALYRYLLLTQCNALNSALPVMFERMGGYTEMLLPNNILRQDSVLGHMVSDIPEEDWQDAVQIIGWLYQYYNTELKDDTFAQLKKNVKITKERIPAATQLFTPDWIVRYMVENSLGRLWLEHLKAEAEDGTLHIPAGVPIRQEGSTVYVDSASEQDAEDNFASYFKTNWKYYLDEAKQEPDVEARLREVRKSYKDLSLKEIKVIDPCMGSGHILVYAFDVLMQIYTSAGWDQREAAQSILKNNLYGLDIDDRAAQLAYFAVMMKARQYDRRLLTRGIQPNIFSIRESNGIQTMTIEYFHKNDPKLKADIESIITEMRDAKEYGSILNITPVDFAGLYARFDEIREDINMMQMSALDELLPLVKCAEVLAQKYDVVVTNPPYAGRRNLNSKICIYLDRKYPDGKMDLFSAFIVRNINMTKRNGFAGFMTPFVWLYLSSYTQLRNFVLRVSSITQYMQPEGTSFKDAAVSLCSFVMCKMNCNYRGRYIKFYDVADMDAQALMLRQIASGVSSKYTFTIKQKVFCEYPDSRMIFWETEAFQKTFMVGKKLEEVCQPRQGMATTNNDLFLRLWHETSINRIGFGYHDEDEAETSGLKWFPYNKGGGFRKWYGNNEYIVNYEYRGKTICDYIDNTPGARVGSNGRVINRQFFFNKSITWSDICGSTFAARSCPNGFIFDVKGSSAFVSPSLYEYILAFLNTKVNTNLLNGLNPSVTTQVGDLKQLPFISEESYLPLVQQIVNEEVELSKSDWDSYETSWDFKRNPLV